MACRSPGERERSVSYTQLPHVMQETVAMANTHQKCTITFCRFCSRLSKLYIWCVGETGGRGGEGGRRRQ